MFNLQNEKLLDTKFFRQSTIGNNSSIVKLDSSKFSAKYLYTKYLAACKHLELGNPISDRCPLAPYNLILTNRWLFLIMRSRDCIRGFSVNALGFAGYLLATEKSEIEWLDDKGPEYLLQKVVYNTSV